MSKFDLDALSLSELKQLEKDVAKAIGNFEERQKAAAFEKVDALAKDLGYSLPDLAKLSVSRKRPASTPKYRHPENAEITWSGRGRKPAWLAEAIAGGKSLKDFAI